MSTHIFLLDGILVRCRSERALSVLFVLINSIQLVIHTKASAELGNSTYQTNQNRSFDNTCSMN